MPQENLSDIYKKLKQRRTVLTKEEFAKKLDYSRAQLHRIMTSKEPMPEGLLEAANALLNDTNYVSRETNKPLSVEERLLRLEANAEVFQIAIASLRSKKIADFDKKFSDLLTSIEEAVKRRSRN